MKDIEKLGLFYLGLDTTSDDPILIESRDLTTHAVILGMTGSGKTGLGIALLEEAAIDGVPALIVDPKGDLADLLLMFPHLSGKDLLPWIEPREADKAGLSQQAYADKIAKDWVAGLKATGQTPERIELLKKNCDVDIYTPGSLAGKPISLLSSLDAPAEEVRLNPGEMRDQILSTVSSLLGLAGIDVDPVQSKEHILISAILDKVWNEGNNLTLTQLIEAIQKPPFSKVGVFDLDTFMSSKERLALAMRFNNLIAAPGFKAWLEGEPLDIQKLLYTKEGKPRLAVLSIAHLSDPERMFFVTTLLNHLVGWMRKQSGTSSLRALLYMDEIFGYFPPTATPPSKLPMLTLLKQARAFGVGVILATQNPVDLDYKGLANCGTWMIGKLQTDRDKERILDGLPQLDRKALDKSLGSLKKREFLLKTPSDDDFKILKTRWTLSYLKGPLTLSQIKDISHDDEAPSKKVYIVEGEPINTSRYEAPAGVKVYYAQKSESDPTYLPRCLGVAKLHFVDAKLDIDVFKRIVIEAPFSDGSADPLWEESKECDEKVLQSTEEPKKGAKFGEPPSGILSAKSKASNEKEFATWLYQNETFDTLKAPDLKLSSKPHESEGDFMVRVNQLLREKRDKDAAAIKAKYEGLYEKLQEKLRAAQQKAMKDQEQVGRQKMDTYISVGSTLLGAIFGKNPLSRGTIDKAGTTARRAQKIQKDEQQATLSQSKTDEIESQIADLDASLKEELSKLDDQTDVSNVKIEKASVRPRKSDIIVEGLSLYWS